MKNDQDSQRAERRKVRIAAAESTKTKNRDGKSWRNKFGAEQINSVRSMKARSLIAATLPDIDDKLHHTGAITRKIKTKKRRLPLCVKHLGRRRF